MKANKNEVIVIGTIHSQHLRSKEYSLKIFSDIIKALKPDYVLAEIPPDRFVIADREFQSKGIINEPRVLQYPEFSQVIFPLQKQIGFVLKPVSAWTKKMADDREIKLSQLSRDKNRAKEWDSYLDAREKSANLFEAYVKEYSPEIIHTDEFDRIMEVELSVYNKLFNDDLGAGGWQNINEAHYALIDKELNAIQYKGKRALVIFGSGHKGWLIKKLKTREDIELKNLLDML